MRRASMLAISHDAHFTQVLQLQHVGEVALVITQLDAGMSLSEYLTQSSQAAELHRDPFHSW